MKGRPKKAVAALKIQPSEVRTPAASSYVGADFAKIFPLFHSEPFLGTVTDMRRPSGNSNVHEVLFKISYGAQLGSPKSSEEEVYENLLAGIKLFKALQSTVTALKASY